MLLICSVVSSDPSCSLAFPGLSFHHYFFDPPLPLRKNSSTILPRSKAFSLANLYASTLYSPGFSLNNCPNSVSNGCWTSGSHRNLRNRAQILRMLSVGPHPSPVSMASQISPLDFLMLGWYDGERTVIWGGLKG